MSHTVTVAPATSDIGDSPESGILYLDPDVVALITEIEDILCAALTPDRQPSAPPATGGAGIEPRLAGRSSGAHVGARSGPVQPVRAVQRSPPNLRTARPQNHRADAKGR
jgi:hypothetical protein